MTTAAKSKRYATLPNCDGCGRFTSQPTERYWSTQGPGGFHACAWYLLCPKCAAKEASE